MARRRWQRPDGTWCLGYRKTERRNLRRSLPLVPDYVIRVPLPPLLLFALGPTGIIGTEIVNIAGAAHVEGTGKDRPWVVRQVTRFMAVHFPAGSYAGTIEHGHSRASISIEVGDA